MTRVRTTFFCNQCGNETPRWQGQCPACGEWNTLVEAPVTRSPRSRPGARSGLRTQLPRPVATPLAEVPPGDSARWASGIDELDFVLGGGIVPGSVVLLGGEPGIGKSTLLLQLAARLQAAGRPVLYASGEESAGQVRMRADRLSEAAGEVRFIGETDLETILAAADPAPAVLVVDSIQTVWAPDLEGVPGSVTQVRECAARLQRFAKEAGTVVFLVGHVTKGGVVAGPRTLEHIVDTVLYFEGSGGLDHRVLRATKNRFGAVDEIGVFRMTDSGLAPVANPSELFLARSGRSVSGTAVAAAIEGTRPLLVEIQALCTRTNYGAAQRTATGLDRQRLALLLAVLEKRLGVPFGGLDVFVNVIGGVRLTEPAADLPVAAALLSSATDRVLPEGSAWFGEVGLGGEVRPVHHVERRLAEAARMGFRCAFLAADAMPARDAGIELVPLTTLRDLMDRLPS